ncbi:predicted protein, partial [Nematostella vectensis]
MLAFCCLPIVRPCNETLQLQLAELMANFSRLDVSFPQVPSYRKRRDLTGISGGNTSSVDKIPVTTGVGDLPNLGDFSSLTDFLASKNSSSSQRKPYCVHPMNSSACLKGFFLDKTSQTAKPCPPASTTDIPMSCCPTEMLAFCCLPIVRPCNETLQLQLAELMANFSRLDVSFPQVPSYRKRRDLTGISRGNTSSVDKIPVTTGVGDLPNLGDFSSLTDFLASKNSSSSQRKPYCVHPMNSSACLKGFFLDKTSQAAKPCPPGFYCPQDQLCIIPCPEGSHCQTGRVVASTDSSSYGCRQAGYCCEPSGKVPIYDPVDNQYICPGSHLPSPCKQGYYCANVTERVICPKGSFCREGSTTPEPCPLLASCEEGVSAPVIMTAGIALLVLILVIAIVIVVGFKYRRPIRFYSQLYVARYLAREKEVFQLDSGLRMVAERAAVVKTRAEKIVPKNYTVDITFKDLNLKLNSGTKKTVLMGVTGKIKSGEVTAVMGPSGAGKTTFLNTLSGKAYYGTRGGEIFINGKKEDDLDMYRTITGFVPQ